MRVIDTQAHWYPRVLLDAYAESSGFPGCRHSGDTYELELLPGHWLTLPMHFVELELQLDAMASAGVDVMVSSSASFGDVDALDLARAREVAFALNDLRAAASRSHPGFVGLATIPWQDTAAALEVLDDAVCRLGLPGVLLHSNIDGRPVDSPHLRPVYERIAELDVPIFLHPTKTVFEEHVRDYGLEVMLGYMYDSSIAALRLILSGLTQELSLTIVHPHCGGTLPYLAGRIDGSYTKSYALGRALPVPPSSLIASLYTDTMCQSAETLTYAKDFYSVEHLLFGSDYPYFKPADSLAFVRANLDEKEAEAVLSKNAARLGLDPGA
jgi:aminocarboxymuconate-semialdehyde decarboxylase